MKRLLNSAKFWTVIVDVVVSVVLYFATYYAASAAVEDVKFVIGAVQPVFALLIAGIFLEDAAKTQAQAKVAAAEHEVTAARIDKATATIEAETAKAA